MRPIGINLTRKSDVGEKIMRGIIFFLIAMAAGMTLSNMYEYHSNLNTLDEYEQRLAVVQQNMKQMGMTRTRLSSGEQAAVRMAAQLQPVLEKHFVSIPELLTDLENLKTKKLKFDEIGFVESEGRYAISIRGTSDNTEAIFQFLDKLNNSSRFTHTLSQQKMTDSRKMEFKLAAEWRYDADI